MNPSTDGAQDLYRTGEYVRRNPSLHTEGSPWKVEQITKMLERNSLAPKRVCDVGCGAGLILALLQRLLPPDAVLHGYEISPAAIALCRQHENDRLAYFCEDIVESHSERYDLLLAIDVFEHIEDYYGWLRKIRGKAALKLFHVPLEISAMSALSPYEFLSSRKDAGHLHFFSRESALASLRDAGYEVVDWFYTPGYIHGFRGRRDKLLRLLLHFASDDFKARLLGGYSIMVLTR